MESLFQAYSFRYALALWLATITALLTAFVVQLEPAQWAGITVWIVFVQTPRMNYSKVIWWAFGTIVGALMATIITVFFNQMPEVLLLFLALWLSGCAAAATFVTSYRAYGAVLAGYTCAIVTMSACEHPEMIFHLAVTRVSCIFIGMVSAVCFIGLLLPKPGHWREIQRHLENHFKATLLQAAKAINPSLGQPREFTWRRVVERLSALEHTLDATTAETADSRIHARQARSLVATLFNLLAKSQAVEIYVTRQGTTLPGQPVIDFLNEAQAFLRVSVDVISGERPGDGNAVLPELKRLKRELALIRNSMPSEPVEQAISDRYILDRVEEVLSEFKLAVLDWQGLFGPWRARRASRLASHKDYVTACIYGVRMFLAMAMVSGIWFMTRWPSGSQLVLFTAVVCSLLSLLDHAPKLGFPFMKSAVFCAIMAYVEAFEFFPRADGFILLALMLGIFLFPAAYAYRHPRLIGGAVVSMLIFYGLSMPSNRQPYDILAFMNNGLALLCAAACGFFAFHAVQSLDAVWRRFWLLRSVRRDLARKNTGSEQEWTSTMFDRIRLLHRTAEGQRDPKWLDAENQMLLGLQVGLRQHQLYTALDGLPPAAKASTSRALRKLKGAARHPDAVAAALRSICARLKVDASEGRREHLGVLGNLREISYLLESSTRLYYR